MATAHEEATNIICDLEVFLTEDKWTQGYFARDEYNHELISRIDPARTQRALSYCELGGLQQVVFNRYGVWLDMENISRRIGVYDPKTGYWVTREGAEEYNTAFPLTEEQEQGVRLAHQTLLEQAIKLFPGRLGGETPSTIRVPFINDHIVQEYDQIRQLNEAACAALRAGPTCPVREAQPS